MSANVYGKMPRSDGIILIRTVRIPANTKEVIDELIEFIEDSFDAEDVTVVVLVR